ncbi:MAG: CBS domain-containing protein [Candidatus Omnitrophica bacterium]|nr:CBS domain-containing protein [Candidatus Omnitrophota bacterium]
MRGTRRAPESPYTVSDNDTIETAMALIEQNNHRSVVVVDARGVVVGTLSDGDIRKAVLDHRVLSMPVHQAMNTHFIAVTAEEADRAKAIFEQQHIFLIPVIDRLGHLVNIMTAY